MAAEVKIYKSLIDDISDEKFKSEFGRGVRSSVSWERLLPYIEHAVGKRLHEEVVGIKIDEKGVTVKFERDDQHRR